MGLFEYKCEKCGNIFQKWKQVQPVDGEHKCDKCGHNGVPMWASPTLVFKGSGWYVNDSKPKASQEVGFASESSD